MNAAYSVWCMIYDIKASLTELRESVCCDDEMNNVIILVDGRCSLDISLVSTSSISLQCLSFPADALIKCETEQYNAQIDGNGPIYQCH